MMDEKLWFSFLWSVGLADSVGECGEAAAKLGAILKLDCPPEELDLPQWLDWLRSKGYDGEPSLWRHE